MRHQSPEIAAAARQRRRYHLKQWYFRRAARLVVRTAIWLFGAYLVGCWHVESIQLYLIVSVAMLIAVNLERQSNSKEDRTAAALPAPAATTLADESESAGRGPLVDGPAAASGRGARRPVASATTAAALPSPVRHAAAASAATGRAAELSQEQQRLLRHTLQKMGTPGAVRCAMDEAFRERLFLEKNEADGAICICGSGLPFRTCCSAVKDQLLAVMALKK